MSGRPQVRRMQLSDLDAVLACTQSLGYAPRWPREAYVAAIDPQAEPHRIALVAVDKEGIFMGFVVAAEIPPEAELESIAVVQQFQRQGIARALCAALVLELQAAGITELLLEVRASNQPAQELYRSLGFRITGHRPDYYSDPVESAILLRRALSSSIETVTVPR